MLGNQTLTEALLLDKMRDETQQRIFEVHTYAYEIQEIYTIVECVNTPKNRGPIKRRKGKIKKY